MHPAGAQLALDDGNLENARLLECALVCAAQAPAALTMAALESRQ
jgi:hypothetical protein